MPSEIIKTICLYAYLFKVLLEHPDFKNGNNPAREVHSVTPEFHVVQREFPRTILVLGITGNRGPDKRMPLVNTVRIYLRLIFWELNIL